MQDFIDDCYVYTNKIADVDAETMQYLENNFLALKTCFGGDTEPTTCSGYTVVPGLTWYDSANLQLKYRNAANDGWICYFPGDTDSKIWAYRNDAVEGMVIDSTVTDSVIALKGGTQAYNVNGGNTAGNWTLNHTHSDGSYSINNRHRHKFPNLGPPDYHLDIDPAGKMPWGYIFTWTDYQGSTTNPVNGTSTSSGPSSSWRPAAAVGVLLKPDL